MTDQTKLRDAVAAIIFDRFERCSKCFSETIADSILSLPDIADALKREEAENNDTDTLDWLFANWLVVTPSTSDALPKSFRDNQCHLRDREDIAACRAAMSGGEKK